MLSFSQLLYKLCNYLRLFSSNMTVKRPMKPRSVHCQHKAILFSEFVMEYGTQAIRQK